MKKKSIEQDISERASDFTDKEIEYQLLAYLLKENPMEAKIIVREWFTDVLLQDVVVVVQDLMIPMSKAMVMNELRDRGFMSKEEIGMYSDALDEVFDVTTVTMTAKTVRHMTNQLFRLSESRRVLVACGKVIGSIRNFDLGRAKRLLADVSRESTLQDEENVVDYLDHYEHRKQTIADKEIEKESTEDGVAGIKTGIYAFDRVTGGVMAGEFGVIAGKTNVGKTAALIEFGATAYEDGKHVFIASGEMAIDEMAFRLDSRFTRISGMKFRSAELQETDYKRWDDTITQYRAMHDNMLFIAAYPRRFTCDDVERDMLRIQEATHQKFDLLCLDYINIVSPILKGRSDWKDQSEAVWDFKGLVKKYGLRGWTAGQIIDDAYEKELYEASDLKYARAIPEAADIIVALIQTDKDRIEGRMKFQVIKMRNADIPQHPIKLVPNLSIMRLTTPVPSGVGTLEDMTGHLINMDRKTKRPRPKRSMS